jgi:hypothetical protein
MEGAMSLEIAQAGRLIHDNDVDGLKQLLEHSPALVSAQRDERDGGLLGMATGAYGDSFEPNRERAFTRAECAELLIDAGAVVTPSVLDNLIRDRPRGLLALFERKRLLPRTLRFRAALGDRDAVLASLAATAHDLAAVNDALLVACRFEHEPVALLLLDRSIALDPGLGRQIDEGVGRREFIKRLIDGRSAMEFSHASPNGPWQAFVMSGIIRAIHDGDVTAFVAGLTREPWVLAEACVGFQIGLIERATLLGRGEFITALLDLDPALPRQQSSPPSQALEIAMTYAKTHLVPVLTRIWPMPHDLPHAAALGDFAHVKRWFDASGALALGDLASHYPCNSPQVRSDLHWEPPSAQHVLDTALAWSVINRHFEVADFLLAHGADINTSWNSHEPASILHHLVFEGAIESMQYLIDRGIDMTIEDYRWNATAMGWARYGAGDEKMARWLEDAERRRRLDSPR